MPVCTKPKIHAAHCRCRACTPRAGRSSVMASNIAAALMILATSLCLILPAAALLPGFTWGNA